MIEIKPPFCLVAIFSPIIRVLIIKIVSVVSFRNPTQSVGISQKGGGGQRMTLLLHITEKYKRWWLQILIDPGTVSSRLNLNLSFFLSLSLSHNSSSSFWDIRTWIGSFKSVTLQEYYRQNSYLSEEPHSILRFCFWCS